MKILYAFLEVVGKAFLAVFKYYFGFPLPLFFNYYSVLIVNNNNNN